MCREQNKLNEMFEICIAIHLTSNYKISNCQYCLPWNNTEFDLIMSSLFSSSKTQIYCVCQNHKSYIRILIKCGMYLNLMTLNIDREILDFIIKT